MQFPVDFLVDTSDEVLERATSSYMNNLLHCHPDNPDSFKLPNGCKVPIKATTVSFVFLYGESSKHKLLTLYSPEDIFTAVAFYLADDWWAVEEVLKTADPTRNGIIQVRSVGERLVLYTLNRQVYRTREMDAPDWTFLCHSACEYAKLLWKDGEAIGFYSVKPTGSLCTNFISERYKLPFLESMFVTRRYRGQGLGLLMLEDFVQSFPNEKLGLKYPLSPAMCRVVERYFQQYPNALDLLWEVQAPGNPYQRVNIWEKLRSATVFLQKPRRANCTALTDTPVDRHSVAIQTSAEEVKQAHTPSDTAEQQFESDADKMLSRDNIESQPNEIENQPPCSDDEQFLSNSTDEKVTADCTEDLPMEEKEVVIRDEEMQTPVEEELPANDNRKLQPLTENMVNDPPMQTTAESQSSEDEREEVYMGEADEKSPISDAQPLIITPDHNIQEGSLSGYSIPMMVIQDEDGNMLSEEDEDDNESIPTTQDSTTRSNPAQSVDSGIEDTSVKERDAKHKRLHSDELFMCLSEVLGGQDSPKSSSSAIKKSKRMKLETQDGKNDEVEIEIHTSDMVLVEEESGEEEDEELSDIPVQSPGEVVAEAAAAASNDEGPAAAIDVETDGVQGDGVQGVCMEADSSNAATDTSGADDTRAEQDNCEQKEMVSTQPSQAHANENTDTSIAKADPLPVAEQAQGDSAPSSADEDSTQKETLEADTEEQTYPTEEEQVVAGASHTPVKENIVKKPAKAKPGEITSPVVTLHKPNTRNKFKNTRSGKKRGMIMSD